MLDGLGTVCKRYGPGRLPSADRADVGAGYAGGAAALGATLLYALVTLVLAELGGTLAVDGALPAVAVAALPFVVPAAFVSGVVVWRLLPADTPHFGAVAGFVATLGTYLGGLILLGAATASYAVLSGRAGAVTDVFAVVGVVGFMAVLLTCWLTLPLGCLCGAIYERVGTGPRER